MKTYIYRLPPKVVDIFKNPDIDRVDYKDSTYYANDIKLQHKEYNSNEMMELITNDSTLNLNDFHEKIDEYILFDSKIEEIEEYRSQLEDDMLLTVTNATTKYKFIISNSGILYCSDNAMKGINNDLHTFLKKNVNSYFGYTITENFEYEFVYQWFVTMIDFVEIVHTNSGCTGMLTTWMTKDEVKKRYPKHKVQTVLSNIRLKEEK